MAEQSRPGPAELEAAGLYDPESGDAPERLALLEYVLQIGVTIDELVAAKPGELPALASVIALWSDRERLSLDEVAVASGVEHELIARTWRAAGFPEPDPDPSVRPFTRRDVEILETLRAGIEFLSEDVAIQLTRVLSASAARVAEASVTAFMVNVVRPAVEHDPSGLELTRRNVESMVLVDGLTRAFDTFLRHHIERGFRPVEEMLGIEGIDLVYRSVGFADLVGSTSWTQELDISALSRALTAFDSTASETVVARGGRVVKLIGDEVMFVADDAATGVATALDLVEAFASHDLLPPVRAGIATGNVVARDGDYSGPVVNLAARAVKNADPSTVLADAATVDALATSSDFSCAAAGSYTLKGFAEPAQLSRVTRTVTPPREPRPRAG
jgi:class 3 adenylate cyclase